MDKGSTLIALVLVILTALPFIVLKINKKMKKMKFYKDFVKLSEKEKVTLSHKELWNNCYAVGIDTDSKKLLYFNIHEDKENGTLIDLFEVEKCRIVNTDRHIKSQNNKGNQANRLDLVFTYMNPNIAERSLEFYKNSEFMPNTEEYAQIENWLNIINSNLKTSPKL
jgi:hypothetical protein